MNRVRLKRLLMKKNESSPFLWDVKTVKIKNMLDRYIALKPDCEEIPIYRRDYEALLKTISPNNRHKYEQELKYHGRQLVVK